MSGDRRFEGSFFKREREVAQYSSTVLPLKMNVSWFFEKSRAPQPKAERLISGDLALHNLLHSQYLTPCQLLVFNHPVPDCEGRIEKKAGVPFAIMSNH